VHLVTVIGVARIAATAAAAATTAAAAAATTGATAGATATDSIATMRGDAALATAAILPRCGRTTRVVMGATTPTRIFVVAHQRRRAVVTVTRRVGGAATGSRHGAATCGRGATARNSGGTTSGATRGRGWPRRRLPVAVAQQWRRAVPAL